MVAYNFVIGDKKMSLIKGLEQVLADTYALYLKTQNYHWNIEGKRFRELHAYFEDQYNDLAEAIDTVAELIRGFKVKTIGTFDAFKNLTKIKDAKSDITDEEMLKDLLADQDVMLDTLKKALDAAKAADDEVVCDFLIGRMTIHSKNAWMMRSSL